MDKESKEENIYHCAVCAKEIPESAALTAEGQDYTWYFCGEACFEKWRNKTADK